MKYIQKIALYILDTIAPPDPVVKRLETMSCGEFMKTISKAQPSEIRALLLYKDPLVKKAILEVKSYGNKRIARLLGDVLHEELKNSPALIIPIPLTKKGLRDRGWNQCELIVSTLPQNYKIHTDILYKIRETADQVGKNRSERFKNLRDCFVVYKPELIRGKHIIVFDDILTTGATLTEAKRVLENAGASVTCLALCH